MDHLLEELKKDNKELIEMLEKLLDDYICIKLATKYPNGIDEAYVARFLKDMKKDLK